MQKICWCSIEKSSRLGAGVNLTGNGSSIKTKEAADQRDQLPLLN